jgi:uncharacterized protein (TIGR02588 family)
MSPKKARGPRKNWLEWLVFAASLGIIATIVGFLVHGAFTRDDTPPRLEVYLGEPRSERGLFIVPVVVQNQGPRPASGVRIEVVVTVGQASEQAGFELSYAPGGSTRRGEVAFSLDPRKGSLRARPPGFELP